jgi:hypothetical protein
VHQNTDALSWSPSARRSFADQRRVDQFLLAVAVEVRPRDVMRCRERIDLLDLPRLSRVAVVTRNPVDARAVGGLHRERALKATSGMPSPSMSAIASLTICCVSGAMTWRSHVGFLPREFLHGQ